MTKQDLILFVRQYYRNVGMNKVIYTEAEASAVFAKLTRLYWENQSFYLLVNCLFLSIIPTQQKKIKLIKSTCPPLLPVVYSAFAIISLSFPQVDVKTSEQDREHFPLLSLFVWKLLTYCCITFTTRIETCLLVTAFLKMKKGGKHHTH